MAYQFLGGALSMNDVVRHANAHGMYFSNRPLPRLSRSLVSRQQGVFYDPLHPDWTIGMDAVASISAAPNVAQWVEQSKDISYIVTATAWGHIAAASSNVGGDQFNLSLALYLGGTLLARTGPELPNVTPEAIGMQNDTYGNNRSAFHMQYALAYTGMRNAASATELFSAKFIFRMDEADMFSIDTQYSEAYVEIGLLDIVADTAGLV